MITLPDPQYFVIASLLSPGHESHLTLRLREWEDGVVMGGGGLDALAVITSRFDVQPTALEEKKRRKKRYANGSLWRRLY